MLYTILNFAVIVCVIAIIFAFKHIHNMRDVIELNKEKIDQLEVIVEELRKQIFSAKIGL